MNRPNIDEIFLETIPAERVGRPYLWEFESDCDSHVKYFHEHPVSSNRYIQWTTKGMDCYTHADEFVFEALERLAIVKVELAAKKQKPEPKKPTKKRHKKSENPVNDYVQHVKVGDGSSSVSYGSGSSDFRTPIAPAFEKVRIMGNNAGYRQAYFVEDADVDDNNWHGTGTIS